MGSTPNRAIPYVEPGDHPNVWPAADQAAANRLEELLFDTGWVACTIRASYAAHTEPPQVRRVGPAVYGRGAWSPTGLAVNANHTVGDLPAGFFTAGLGSAVIAGGSAASAAQPTAVIVNLASGTIQIRTGAALPTWIYINALTYFLS